MTLSLIRLIVIDSAGVKSCYPDRSLPCAIQEDRITKTYTNLILAFIAERRITAIIRLKQFQKIAFSLIITRRFAPPFS